MSFRTANIWKTFDNSKSLDGKFHKKSFFSRKGRELDELVLWFGVYFNLKSSVYVDVEVVCVLRPSSRLCLEESSFASNATLIFDIRPSIRPTLRKGLMA